MQTTRSCLIHPDSVVPLHPLPQISLYHRCLHLLLLCLQPHLRASRGGPPPWLNRCVVVFSNVTPMFCPPPPTRAMGTSTYTIVGCLLHRHNLSKACGSRRGAWQGQVSVYGGAVGRNRRGDEAGNHTRKCPSRCGWSLPPLQSSFMMGLIYLGCGERNWVQW